MLDGLGGVRTRRWPAVRARGPAARALLLAGALAHAGQPVPDSEVNRVVQASRSTRWGRR